MGANLSGMGLIPQLSPSLFVYFDIVGGYLGFADRSIGVALDAAAGEIFGQVVWNFMTNTKTDLWGLMKCAATFGAGAFIGAKFILPMIGVAPSPLVLCLVASLGGHLMKWLLAMFGMK